MFFLNEHHKKSLLVKVVKNVSLQLRVSNQERIQGGMDDASHHQSFSKLFLMNTIFPYFESLR